MWVFNEPAVRCVFQCCSTVYWRDLNRQSKDNREEKKHQPPALCTLWQIKKAAVIDKAKPCPCGIAECGFGFNHICLMESEKAKNPMKMFFWLLLPPQTSLGQLIKRPGLPGYCLCIWLTGLCQLFILAFKQCDHTVEGKQGIGSNHLMSHKTDISGPLLGLKQTNGEPASMLKCEINIHILLTLFFPCIHLWHHPILIKRHIKLNFLTSVAWTTLKCYLFMLIIWWLLQAPGSYNLGDN